MLIDPKKTQQSREEDPFFDEEDVVSFTECTGVAPAGLMDGWQQNNAAALYAIHNRIREEENPLDDTDWPE